jgi:hypothetical protein
MREHFGVGLRVKGVAFALELVAERGVVLDHAVVHERELAALIKVRMRFGIADAAVRRPARVGDAGLACDR